LIVVDTSITVPGFSTWHERHERALRVLEREPRLPAHVAAETFSVLTRLPDPHRVEATAVLAYLRSWFTGEWLALSPKGFRDLLTELTGAGQSGGAVYDGIVGATALQAKATLVTADRRALATYSVLGVPVEFVE
jgi:predicted nucleic acid-binding protein